MLQLKDIKKDYVAGDTTVHALKGVSIAFRESEFVSILGQSGCGKTTMLNIIGGLDRYTSGDLIIGGRSTKEFKDKDWDSYRNHKIGFVFQNYNLIPHQTVLANVELALTLSGVSKSERKKRAIEALEKVGLKDQIHKKPNQMSGGQMQRVAIARALVNDPDIILADEPTGALDSETSVQIMNILKNIANEKLIIMVTHNGELAEEYSSRIIRLLDGKVIGDTAPYEPTEEDIAREKASSKPAKKKRGEKVSMSFFTALSLSFKNLLTKKGRTFLTAFAGSIGIIGIALILSLSNGFQEYINKVQEDTISTYPITIENEGMDMTSLMESMMGKVENEVEHEPGKIYTNSIMGKMINTMFAGVKTNSLAELKAFFESEECEIDKYVTDIQYGYDMDINIYAADTSNGIVKVNPSTMMEDMMGMGSSSSDSASMLTSTYSNSNMWTQMIDNQELLESQYDVIAGHWPTSYNEVVLVASEDYEITDVTLYALGLKDSSELKDLMYKFMNGETINTEETSYTYDELLSLTFKLVITGDFYEYDETTGRWNDKSSSENYTKELIENGTEIRISGIVKPNEGAVATSITGSIGYTKALTEYVLEQTEKCDAVIAQKADPDTDIFTGLPFADDSAEIEDVTIEDIYAYIATLPDEEQQAAQMYFQMMTEQQIIELFKTQIMTNSESTYSDNLVKLGYADETTPSYINLYAKDFASKDSITEIIDDYNQKAKDDGNDSLVITYTDYIGLMMSSVSTIIDTISYVLIAFVSISLVVSSIMIAIITYTSVLERTKEIGILRSIGASKHDVSSVFNAETMIIGLVSGSLGIGVTLLLNIPINLIIKAITDIPNVSVLPLGGALILIAISVILTLIAGLIPSKIAARKDPVIALRSE